MDVSLGFKIFRFLKKETKTADRNYHQELTKTPGRNELKNKTHRYEKLKKKSIFYLKVENRMSCIPSFIKDIRYFDLSKFSNKTLKTCFCICIIDCQASNLAKNSLIHRVSNSQNFLLKQFISTFLEEGRKLF